MTDLPDWSNDEKWVFLVARRRSDLLTPMWDWASDTMARARRYHSDDPVRRLRTAVSGGFDRLAKMIETRRPEWILRYEADVSKIVQQIIDAVARYVEIQTQRYRQRARCTSPIPEEVTAQPFKDEEESAFDRLRSSLHGRARRCFELGDRIGECLERGTSTTIERLCSTVVEIRQEARFAGVPELWVSDLDTLLHTIGVGARGPAEPRNAPLMLGWVARLDVLFDQYFEEKIPGRSAKTPGLQPKETGPEDGQVAKEETPSAESTVQAPGSPTVMDELHPRFKTAFGQYLFAEGKLSPETPTDQQAYVWLIENLPPSESGELPCLETWMRYVRRGRKASGQRKNRPRHDRPHGSSVASSDQI